MFTYADKRNVTVAMNKSSYKEYMNALFSDRSTYSTIKKSPLKKLQEKAYDLFKRWNKNRYLKHVHKDHELTQTNTSLLRAYDLPKVHKQNYACRPVIPTVGSPMYDISKRLYNVLSNCIDRPKSHVRNSYEFISKLKNIKIPRNYRVIILDVQSLFTNVGKKLVIQALEKRACQMRAKSHISFDEIIAATELLFDYNSIL